MRKETFELYGFKGKKVLFTPVRVHHLQESIPEGMYKYEIRHSDEGFEPCELAEHIIVNHYGTIFSSIPIDLGESGYIDFEEDRDFIDLNQIVTIDEYLNIMEEKHDMKEQEMKMMM